MLGIEINGESLDLLPGVSLELQKENPFLQFNDELIGDYSLPLQVKASPKNLRLLNYAAIAKKVTDNTGIDAFLYDGSKQIGAGKIKIEKASINLNRTPLGSISCYYLSSVGGFWQDIKDVKFRDINVGGDRSFPWDGGNPDSGPGFWHHIHAVVAGEVTTDYVFFPVINKGWPLIGVYPPLMNKVYYDIGVAHPVHFPEFYTETELSERNRIVPFPYLKYVLVKAFEYVGWNVTGDILTDVDFEKITMINFRAIDWCKIVVTDDVVTADPHDPVVFNLKDHLPDITLSAFLIALKNRFGWWYDFDNSSKIVTIRTLQSLTTGPVTDMTEKSSPLMNKNILQAKPIYALRNNFATSLGQGAPDFKVINYIGDVDSTGDLPVTGLPDRYGHVYLVREENNYYICYQNPEDEVWQWWPYTYNIYDYEPAGANAEIITDATVVGQERYDSYLDLIPRIDNQGEWMGRASNPNDWPPTEENAVWGIHLVFYYGLRDNKSGDPVPYASHHLYDSQGNQLADWSLAFRGQKTVTGEQVGLYDKNWKDFLDMISGAEEFEHTLSLPLHEYLQLKFSNRINVSGVQLFIKQIRPVIPYKGKVECTSIRV